MKPIQLIVKILFSIFFSICVLVHVAGLFGQYVNEPLWSHIVHIISYCMCFYSLLFAIRYRFWIYMAGAIYPWYYHANCAWMSYTNLHQYNRICLLVVVMMPLGAAWVLSQVKSQEAV